MRNTLQFDPTYNPYNHQRAPLYSKRGMVATSQPLAAVIGSQILSKGGNAIDAAIATAAALTVVEPTCNGVGGDAFALIWHNGKLHGINGSGPSPNLISLEAMKKRGFTAMPLYGWESVTVPGAVATWSSLSDRFGKLPFGELLEPAIRIAADGYAVSPNLSKLWKSEYERFKKHLHKEMFNSWFSTFAPKGRAPFVGEIWSSQELANTLSSIAQSGGDSFYRGELAKQIDAFSRQGDGFLRYEDLESYSPLWVEPINTTYRGFKVWEIPPNGQGLSALLALNILEHFESLKRDDEISFHRSIEATKLAMSDGHYYITDPSLMKIGVKELLSKEYASLRASQIKERAQRPTAGNPSKGGTVYLATSDEEGNMVSYIQSNYEGFGSGLVVPNTAIALQNRGNNFSMDHNHINCVAPNKRTFHTIIPGFLTSGETPIGPFGVMGGFNQPQGHIQVVTNTIDNHLNPQSALDAPRWRWVKDNEVLVEPEMPLSIVESLRKRGHNITISEQREMFGRGQIIWRDKENSTYVCGCESRTDSLIVPY